MTTIVTLIALFLTAVYNKHRFRTKLFCFGIGVRRIHPMSKIRAAIILVPPPPPPPPPLSNLLTGHDGCSLITYLLLEP